MKHNRTILLKWRISHIYTGPKIIKGHPRRCPTEQQKKAISKKRFSKSKSCPIKPMESHPSAKSRRARPPRQVPHALGHLHLWMGLVGVLKHHPRVGVSDQLIVNYWSHVTTGINYNMVLMKSSHSSIPNNSYLNACMQVDMMNALATTLPQSDLDCWVATLTNVMQCGRVSRFIS
jgi:hypothetical protein